MKNLTATLRVTIAVLLGSVGGTSNRFARAISRVLNTEAQLISEGVNKFHPRYDSFAPEKLGEIPYRSLSDVLFYPVSLFREGL